MLSKFETYKISRKSLSKYKKKGFSDAAIDSLSSLEEKFFPTSDLFLAHIKKLPNSSEILKDKQSVLKYSRGYLRLDRWITNKTTREWTEALIFALVVATIVRTFLFGPFRIPSGSMIPTIQIGDQIFASMFSYGIPVPFTDLKIAPQAIQRGDIVIFPYPKNPEIDYIKRTVALGGETIEIKNDQVYINGKKLDEPYAYFDPRIKKSVMRMDPRVVNFGPKTVPENHLFVMGDNRYNSQDSRFWGYVDIKKVKGKGQMVYWSKEPRDSLIGFFELDSYRLSRIFHFLHSP